MNEQAPPDSPSSVGPTESELDRLERLAATLAARLAPPLPASALEQVWRSSPLSARLGFLRSVQPVASPLLGALRDAESLAGRLDAGESLSDWAMRYPELLAEVLSRLAAGTQVVEGPLGVLIAAHLGEVKALVEQTALAAGLTAFAPLSGSRLGAGVEAAGTEASSAVEAGFVLRVVRPGILAGGRILVPALVITAAAPDGRVAATGAAPPVDAGPAASEACIPSGSAALDAALGADARAAITAVRESRAAGTAPPATVVESLLGLMLGTGAEAAAVATWMRAECAWELLVPAEGDEFDPERMEVAGLRVTAHSHEAGRVARMLRPGVLASAQPLLRARVLRYSTEGGPL